MIIDAVKAGFLSNDEILEELEEWASKLRLK